MLKSKCWQVVFFWKLQGRIPFLFQFLEAAHTPGLMALFHFLPGEVFLISHPSDVDSLFHIYGPL